MAVNTINLGPTTLESGSITATPSIVTPTSISKPSGINPATVLSGGSGFGSLRFPPDTGIYYLSLPISEYLRSSVLDSVNLKTFGTITLPIPANLLDSMNLKFSPQERPTVLGMGTNQENGAGGAGVGPVGYLGGLGLRAAGAGADSVITGLGAATAQAFGVAPNPFLTIMFQSPNFKEHTFKWKFSPKTAAESLTIKQIVNTLKFHAAPDVAGPGGAYLTYPDVFTPVLYPNSDSLYVFQPCVLTSVTALYAPSGSPAFFGGTQAPAEVELRLSFLELALWVKSNMPRNNVVF